MPANEKAKADTDAYYLEALHTTSSLITKSSKPAVVPEMLLSKWNIALVKAKQTLKVMTQAGEEHTCSIRIKGTVWKKAHWLKFPS